MEPQQLDKSQDSTISTEPDVPARPKRENMLVNVAFNVLIPIFILTKFSGEEHLGPTWGIVVALAFPIAYGIKDYFRASKVNFFSALGIFSVCMTGGIALLELDQKYIAYKEASIPLLLGLAVVGSLKTPWPLVRTFLYSDLVFDIERIELALKEHGTKPAFEKALFNSSWMLAGSFFVSAILNYVLARLIVVSPTGTEEFNAEIAKMTGWSYVVILIPSMIILMGAAFYLFRQITKLTHMELEDIMIQPEK